MYSPTVNKVLLALSILMIVTLACSVNIENPTGGEAPTAENTPLVQPSPVTTTRATFGRLSLEIPSSIATGASGRDIAPLAAEDTPYWEKTPGHLQVSLGDYYILQGTFHQPQIYVYPALEYAQLVPAAFESMHRLRNYMHTPDAISLDQLPAVPFFNAAQVFASKIQPISFQNGSGIRLVTQYAQGFVPVNNQDLFYHFQGFTDDGNDYIVAVLPLTSPVLAQTDDPGAPLPAGGIPLPDLASADPNMRGYFDAIAVLLDAQPQESFSPTLSHLDALIQSMWVAP